MPDIKGKSRGGPPPSGGQNPLNVLVFFLMIGAAAVIIIKNPSIVSPQNLKSINSFVNGHGFISSSTESSASGASAATSTRSSYYRVLRIGSVSPGDVNRPYDQVVMYALVAPGKKVNVAGWSLHSRSGKVLVPDNRGALDLSNGDQLTIYGGQGGISGTVVSIRNGFQVSTGERFLNPAHDDLTLVDSRGVLIDEYRY